MSWTQCLEVTIPVFQVVLIGDAGVGKTCAVQRFKHGVYIERHGNTIGVDFMLKTVEVEGSRIKVCGRLQSCSPVSLCKTPWLHGCY